MKEILNIIDAYTLAVAQGKKMALATVVHVEGSSYRRPGARMLVTDDGNLTGAISGGCLEGDALRKALLAINQQQNKLVTYDTSDDDDDARFGVQLGCNGIVHILFEPIDTAQVNNPIGLLRELTAKRQDGVLVTLFSLSRPHEHVPGTCMLIIPEAVISREIQEYEVNAQILEDANHALLTRNSFIRDYKSGADDLSAFVEFTSPSIALVIAGAGNDAFPLLSIAHILGWHTTVVDGRSTHATIQRFPLADKILLAKPEQVIPQLILDEQTVFVLMTHNYNYDLALLKELVNIKSCQYIGSLGPRKKLERMLNDLKAEGIQLNHEQLAKIYGPVGLDLGSETAEEIALAITAEIKKVLSAGSGLSLRQKQEPIHQLQKENSIIDL